MKLHILTSLLLATTTLSWAVPSKINYQGRLSDTFGEPLTGDVSITLKMFDASVAGGELYVEDIGNVSLDDNGFYSFQFGSGGQAVAQAEELIGTSDGSSTTYNGAITSTMLNASLVVSDGTNSWNVVDGNPGVQATGSAIIASGFVVGINITNAGEAYVDPPAITIEGDGTGASASAVVENGSIAAIAINNPGAGYSNATVTFDQYPTPYLVNYSSVTGEIGVTYDTAPAVGTEIMATYETPDSSIVGALSASDSHWLELTIDGVVQSPRERILSVPFAQVSGSAEQAGGDLAEAIASLNSNPDLPVVFQRGYTKEGDDAITIPAGYRMKILSRGSVHSNSAYYYDNAAYSCTVRLEKDGQGYGFMWYKNLEDSYIDGPIEVKAYSRSSTGWFSYELGPIPDDAVLSRGYTKEGDNAITIPAGYRMRILSRGSDHSYSAYYYDNAAYSCTVRLQKDGQDYGYMWYENLEDSYIDGPIEVKAYSRSSTGWFSYEIKKISLGEQ